MQLKELQLLRETLEQYVAGGMPWLPDKHHWATHQCLRILRREIRAIAKRNKEEKNAKALEQV